jgi:hypothetical protein
VQMIGKHRVSQAVDGEHRSQKLSRSRIHCRRCSNDLPPSGSCPHKNALRTQRCTACTI